MEHLHGTPRRRLVGAAARASRAVGALLPLLGALYVGARGVVASADVPDRLERGGEPDRAVTVAPRRVAPDRVVPERITPENVGRLRLAWSYPTADGAASRFDPIVVDGLMYVRAQRGTLAALDAATGRERWVRADLHGVTRHNVSYWESDDRRDRRLLVAIDDTLQAIDARTGQSILAFGTGGRVDLREGPGRDPSAIARVASQHRARASGRAAPPNGMAVGGTGLAFATARDGHVYALDAATGAVRWSAPLPAGSVGSPAMYETGGRQYLVVSATTPLPAGLGQGGYLVFTLPAP
jgi:glucose dehydrogenase